jgi:hypothetical protein
MADLVFNIAKGRVHQLAKHVDDGSPTNARLILIPFNSSDTDDAVRDSTTVAAVEALGSTAERTTGGWNRKTLGAADVKITVDNTNDRVDIDIPDQTWTAVSAGNNVTDLLIAYDDDTTAGTDANLVPLTWHDFAVTTDGSDITAVINTAGFYRAT